MYKKLDNAITAAMINLYTLSKEKNAQIEKFLVYQREGRTEELTEEELKELEALKTSLK